MFDKIGHELLDAGFLPVLGTSEQSATDKGYILVRRGTKRSYAQRNGIIVVSDNQGIPWINWETVETIIMLKKMIKDHHLRHRLHVPHANDQGKFLSMFITR